MLKVGDKLRILYPFSVFRGCIVTVQREDGPGRFVCTTPERPQGECIVHSDGEGNALLFRKVNEDDGND